MTIVSVLTRRLFSSSGGALKHHTVNRQSYVKALFFYCGLHHDYITTTLHTHIYQLWDQKKDHYTTIIMVWFGTINLLYAWMAFNVNAIGMCVFSTQSSTALLPSKLHHRQLGWTWKWICGLRECKCNKITKEFPPPDLIMKTLTAARLTSQDIREIWRM